MYRVLVIAGVEDSDGGILNLGDELDRLIGIGEIYDSIQVDMIPAGSSELDIVSQIALGNAYYDAIHFLGHADERGFYLTSYDILSPQKILSLCNDAGARTAFLNSCMTAALGQYLVNSKLAIAICCASRVMDRDAIINAIRFYSALARSTESFLLAVKEGYQAADPGDGSLLWLTNGEYTSEVAAKIVGPVLAKIDAVTNEQGVFGVTLGETKTAVQQLDARVTKDVATLTTSTVRTRHALSALLTVVLAIAAFTLLFSIPNATAQTVPRLPTRIGATIPPLPTPNKPGTIPPAASPEKPTRKPTPTKKPKPTRRPTRAPTATQALAQPTLVLPTPWISPSSTHTSPPPTATATINPTRKPTATTEDTPIPVYTEVVVTNTPVPPSAFQIAVQTAVSATIEALNCICSTE